MIQDFDDFKRMLLEHPEWRQELRQLLLSDELLRLPAAVAALTEAQAVTERRLGALTEAQAATDRRLAALTDQVAQLDRRLTERMDQLTERIDRLTEHMDQLTAALNRLTERVDALATQVSTVADRADLAIGYMLESKYRARAHAYFQQIARRIRVLDADELEDLLEAGMAAGQLEDWQAKEIRWADAVMRGRREDQDVLLVLEASVGVDERDVERAAQRAEWLALTGVATIPVVAGEYVVPSAWPKANAAGVWRVTNGTAEEPPPKT